MPDDRSLHYADQAFITLSRLMSNNKKDMLEHMNRAHKGELFVLQFLAKSKTEALPSELSSALHASTARISALLGSLEKKGQIRRDIDTRNRRNILVTITDAGRKRVKVEMLNMKASMTQVFIDMGEADTAEFLRLLKRFIELSQSHMPKKTVRKKNNCSFLFLHLFYLS